MTKSRHILSMRFGQVLPTLVLTVMLGACATDDHKTAEYDDTPTSGQLDVYCDEAFFQKMTVQMLTFESQYPKADVRLTSVTEAEAVKALYENKCELIVLGRELSQEEKKAFKTIGYSPAYSRIAETGLALITNKQTPVSRLSQEQIESLIARSGEITDSAGKNMVIRIVFDRDNSSVMSFAKDSIAKGKPFSSNCSSLGTTIETIRYVQANKNAIGLIDFSWLSDQDDSLYRATQNDIKFIAVETHTTGEFALPGQSSFKLQTYPYRRVIHAIRKTGDFTLAKGFESYLAGPKGQLTFLKQGLLPTRQGERSVHINLE